MSGRALTTLINGHYEVNSCCPAPLSREVRGRKQRGNYISLRASDTKNLFSGRVLSLCKQYYQFVGTLSNKAAVNATIANGR